MIVTFYKDNVSPAVVEAQKKVFNKFGYEINQVLCTDWQGHGGEIDNFLTHNEFETILIVDIDCIPLTKEVIDEAFDFAKKGGIFSVAQKASHIENSIIYASPAFIAFSRDTYERLGKPTFACTERSDCAGEMTYAAREKGVEVRLLYPTHVEQPQWPLDGPIMFGPGTTYGSVYHGFYSRRGMLRLVDKAEEVCKS